MLRSVKPVIIKMRDCVEIKWGVYPSCFKIWEFAKASTRDFVSSKQSPIQEIGVIQRGQRVEMLAKGKTKFWNRMGIIPLLINKLAKKRRDSHGKIGFGD